MVEGERFTVRLGVSACLLGERVRYDGGHTRDAFLTDTLGPFVEWMLVCPEVEIGLGTPRDTIRLVDSEAAPRLVVQSTGEDLSTRMRRFAATRSRELEALGLDGYVLRRASSTCGLFRVRVYREDGQPGRVGRGLYAAALVDRMPALPVEEEGRLTDARIRESFVERIFAAARWRAFLTKRPRARPRGVPCPTEVRRARAQPIALPAPRTARGTRGDDAGDGALRGVRRAAGRGPRRARLTRAARERPAAHGRLLQAPARR